jgi:subtilisin
MADLLPAIRIADASDPLPPELSDAELVEAVRLAGGQVTIGLKPASAGRTRETGIVPAIDRVTALAARAAVQALGVEITMSYRYISAVAATVPPELAPRLRRLPVVDYVQPSFPGYGQGMLAPQDTSWGPRKIYAPHVWAGTYGPSTRGEWAYVTILDYGVDEAHRWWGDGPESMYLDCYWVEGTGAQDCYGGSNGHGAHVAGIIASRDDAQGYIGIAHDPQGFASIKVCNAQGCAPEWIAAGLDWATGSGRPRHIVNVSLGLCYDDLTLREAVARASAAGILLIASAGNAWQNANTCPQSQPIAIGFTEVMWPARYSEVMAVSGTWQDDQFASPPLAPPGGQGGGYPGIDSTGTDEQGASNCSAGSRSGPQIEIAAPFSALSMVSYGLYGRSCGTSMSAPVVAAVAALVWSRNPGWSAAQVRQRLRQTAVPLGSAWQFGSGRVNALNAVYLIPAPPPPPPPLSVGLSGYGLVRPFALCSWFAAASGGTPPYSFAWQVDGQSVGDGTSVLAFTNAGSDFWVNVLVTDAGGGAAANAMSVGVSSGANECLDQ